MGISSLLMLGIPGFVCFYLGRKSLFRGFIAVMAIGYFYGILRANIPGTTSHFIFDAGVIGFYAALCADGFGGRQKYKVRQILPWFLCLTLWPILMFFIPMQVLFIRMVGLRGNIFFLPFLLVGAAMEGKDAEKLASAFAILNIVVFSFAVAEVVFGLAHFYPVNQIDELIYRSQDVLVGRHADYRIPATFVASAPYASNMVLTMPFLLGALAQRGRMTKWKRRLLMTAVGCSAMGVFLAASRSDAVFLMAIMGAVTFSGRVRSMPRAAWLGIIAAVVLVVAMVPRMQRFVTLGNTKYDTSRISSSVNQGFFTLMEEYPMGNGLGGGGTSIPYFLKGSLRNPVHFENEYARIMLEQGIPGLMLWLAFIIWLFSRPSPKPNEEWYIGRWIARFVCAFSFLAMPIGTGALNAIPQTALFMVFCGWICAPAVTMIRQRASAQSEVSEHQTAAAF